MATAAERSPADSYVPVIDLSQAPGEGEAWNRPKWMIYLWSATELVLVTNPWQTSSGLRTKVLRAFGAKIGDGVIIRPRTRIKFPWNLEIGDRSWIGEGVWIHNQNQVTIGHDAVVSQETFITTGSHAHRKDMGLITRPVTIDDGAWVTSRCVVTGGVTVGRSALVQPLTLVNRDVEPDHVVGPAAAEVKGRRFKSSTTAGGK
ncbi:acetyltransferase [Kocuria sp. CCUG 69068]|uniref:acetyltransferase n=1 Tax=Kocuria sp. CCUG 69068 TaxID=2043138 RepID=UPI001E45775A|nr:acetyltransferase [Kocuria sp. CCUG 69068]